MEQNQLAPPAARDEQFVRRALYEIASQEVGSPQRAADRLAVLLGTKEAQRDPNFVEAVAEEMSLWEPYCEALQRRIAQAPAEEVRVCLDRLIERNPTLYDFIIQSARFRWRADYQDFFRHRREFERDKRAEQLRSTEEAETLAATERHVKRRETLGRRFGYFLPSWWLIGIVVYFLGLVAVPTDYYSDVPAGVPIVGLFVVAAIAGVALRRLLVLVYASLGVVYLKRIYDKEEASRIRRFENERRRVLGNDG